MSEDRPGFWEAFARRPSLVELVAAGILCFVLLLATSEPGWNLVAFLLTFFLAVALVGLWCLHWVAGLLARARGTVRSALTAREWLAWAVLPVLLFGCYFQARLDLTLRLRFALSRSAFEEFDRSVREGDPTPEGLGLYGVRRLDFVDGRPHIGTGTTGIFNYSGFVRLPEGPPGPRSNLTYSRLAGDWYAFYWSD